VTAISLGLLGSLYLELSSSHGDVMLLLADTPNNRSNATNLKAGDSVQTWCAGVKYLLATPTLNGCHIVTGPGGDTTPILLDPSNGIEQPANASEVAPGASSRPIDPSLPPFIRKVYALADECQGGIDPQKTDRACAARDAAERYATDQGWCFDGGNKNPDERLWKKCSPNPLRPATAPSDASQRPPSPQPIGKLD
jgi:hypothetical protein